MKDTTFLKRQGNGVWFLWFRLPQRFGGKLLRISLHTTDKQAALGVRDRFVMPVLSYQSGLAALEFIGKAILETEKEAAQHLSRAKTIIEAREGLTVSEAVARYEGWIGGSSGLRPATAKKYRECLRLMTAELGGDKRIEMLTKDDASRARDAFVSAGKSPTTLSNIFAAFRSMLRWLTKEGVVYTPWLVDNFDVSLPPVRKVHTPIIPPSMADEAVEAVPEWTLIPRIQRYTGMRITEVEACLSGAMGCGIVEREGYWCFLISRDFSKTHEERMVPVADRLMPYLNEYELDEARGRCRCFAAGERAGESKWQKRYNRAIKRLPGCERCKDHSWRVYAQTMMIEAGVDDLIVRRIIGHSGGRDVHYGYTAGRIEAMKRALDKIP